MKYGQQPNGAATLSVQASALPAADLSPAVSQHGVGARRSNSECHRHRGPVALPHALARRTGRSNPQLPAQIAGFQHGGNVPDPTAFDLRITKGVVDNPVVNGLRFVDLALFASDDRV